MNHGMNQPACMLLQRLLLLRACMRACVAACVIDTMYQLIYIHVGADGGVENRMFV
jgi:hypothetical protein